MSDTRVQQYQDHAGAEAVDSSGLEVKRLTFLEAVAMIVGTNIGAGVLSMAYASRKAGFMPLLLWLAVAGLFTTISMLYVSETALRTRTHNQLSGLAQRYVGSFGAWAIFLSVAVNSIGALIAMSSKRGGNQGIYDRDDAGTHEELRARVEALGQEMEMQINLTRQEVFDAMHTI